jgi:hypothetical protein
MSETTNIAGRAAAGIDQRADVGVARGDHAVERHGDLLVAGQRFQPLDIGLPELTAAFLLERSAVRSSISCAETKFEATSDLRRVSVASDSLALACWLARSARACSNCWSRSGASISAITWPAFTCAPISAFQLFR